MIYVLLSLFFFLLSVIGHIFLHRFLLSYGVKTYRSIYILGFGFIATLLLLLYLSTKITSISWWNVSLPITASLIYALLSFLYFLYFANAYLGEDSPSSRIFYHLEGGAKSYEQIISYFSDASLVHIRLRNLIDAGMVIEKSGVYIITNRGRLIMFIFEKYRNFFRWNKGG